MDRLLSPFGQWNDGLERDLRHLGECSIATDLQSFGVSVQ